MILLLASLAWADIPPPDAEPCSHDLLGKPCTYQGSAGVCQEATRSRATPDGPKESTYIACRPGAEAPAAVETTSKLPIPAPAAEEARCVTSAPGGGLLALLALGLLTRRRR